MKWFEVYEYEFREQQQSFIDSLNWFEKIIFDHLYYYLFLIYVILMSWSLGTLIALVIIW